jgi:hypothetical protein
VPVAEQGLVGNWAVWAGAWPALDEWAEVVESYVFSKGQ